MPAQQHKGAFSFFFEPQQPPFRLGVIENAHPRVDGELEGILIQAKPQQMSRLVQNALVVHKDLHQQMALGSTQAQPAVTLCRPLWRHEMHLGVDNHAARQVRALFINALESTQLQSLNNGHEPLPEADGNAFCI